MKISATILALILVVAVVGAAVAREADDYINEARERQMADDIAGAMEVMQAAVAEQDSNHLHGETLELSRSIQVPGCEGLHDADVQPSGDVVCTADGAGSAGV